MGINTEIAFTYLVSRAKQTIVASLGVAFGVGMFIFMNSLISGTNEWSEKIMLNSTPHLRLYRDHEVSDNHLLDRFVGKGTINLISNPQFLNRSNNIANPDALVSELRQQREVVAISKQVSTNVIYSNGNAQESGNLFGVNIFEQDKMFDITSTLVAGSTRALAGNPNGILIGIGLSEKLNVETGDFISVATANGSVRRMEVVGVFKTTIKGVDNAKSYANIPVVQQLMQKDRSFITEVYINIRDYNNTRVIAEAIGAETGYAVEQWQSTNEQSLAGKKIRDIIANAVVVTILIVAGFGIYNILNMIIYEKMKEIAILKATGFQGAHVVSIFIQQALLIGIVGSLAGLSGGWLLASTVSKMYIGLGNVTHLPMAFHLKHYVQGALFGVITSFFAGYIPAIKASKVDPIQIMRA